MKRIIVTALLLPAALLLGACQDQSEPLVKIGDNTITKNDLYTKMEESVGKQLLTELAYKTLLEEHYNVDASDVDARVEELKKQYALESEEDFQNFLQSSAMTEGQLREQLELGLLFDEARFDGVTVTDDQIQESYEERKRRVQAKHILMETEEEAKDILAKLENGLSFEEAAKTYSKDTATKDNGGDLDFFGKNEGMDPSFETAAFSLEVGETSDPVATQFGYHIIHVTDEQIVPFEELEEALRAELKEANSKSLGEIVEDLQNKTKVTIKDKKYDTLFDVQEEENHNH
ncbi:peptidylprolyl isomerase (plasmid) [Pontibacillus sp. ALD_SL1]|uniref:peptidylprolyl isomerase n=1 Tax=Pontibacillus sp. ALD_SL1 TaxID=2777185 RepID=UPI001A9711B9|nr:peptidylprolyl isomerase [Pontibacillus sp. ALD_SL1]QST02039.1 peptidylprolyl isomerase [Pontibacillus sp. ALD_SL1]